jgi:hypothetical protein
MVDGSRLLVTVLVAGFDSSEFIDGWKKKIRVNWWHRKKRAIQSHAVAMAAGMSSARERNKGFRIAWRLWRRVCRWQERETSDPVWRDRYSGSHDVGKRNKGEIPRWGSGWVSYPQKQGTSDCTSGAVGMVAGIVSARERNERLRQLRGRDVGGDGSGHVIRKRKQRVIPSDAAGIPAGISLVRERMKRFSKQYGGQYFRKRKELAMQRVAQQKCHRQYQEAVFSIVRSGRPSTPSGWDIGSLVRAPDGLHQNSPSSP